MKGTLERKISIANMFIIKKYMNKTDLYNSVDFESQDYILRKESLKTMLELFNEFSVSDFIENIDDVALCLNLIHLAAKTEIESENTL